MSQKTKYNPPKKPRSDFIRFTPVQQAYLNEVRTRQFKEFQDVIEKVYEDLGIMERVSKALPGTYTLRKDCSGVDVLPIEKK